MKMPRCYIVLAIVLSLFVYMPTSRAEGSGSIEVPQEVRSFISQGRWSEWIITGWVNPRNQRQKNACAFAAVKQGSKNDLLAFGWDNGGWAYKWHNAAALPQVEAPILLTEITAETSTDMVQRLTGACFQSMYVVNNELQEADSLWIQNNDGTWHLRHLQIFRPFMCYDMSVDNMLRIYDVGWVEGPATDERIHGVIQTDLRYFSFSDFPKTVQEAREKLSNPPRIPKGTLSAKRIKFTSGRRYQVFQGPGTQYGQSGNGRAYVSTNDWIQVFGEENGWILIQYDITKDHMRFGWIAASSLPKNTKVDELRFLPVPSITVHELTLTDDPLFSQPKINSVIPAQTKVLWLASMGEWAYVEIPSQRPLRGFVQANKLLTE